MEIKKSLVILFLVSILMACANVNNQTKPIQSPINPNGDSELALLMRVMFNDGMKTKQNIKKGLIPGNLNKFREIHSAKATEPEKAASKEYEIFANDYIRKIELLENSKKENIEEMYQAMIQSCMNCHQSMCPGPMIKIKKLFL